MGRAVEEEEGAVVVMNCGEHCNGGKEKKFGLSVRVGAAATGFRFLVIIYPLKMEALEGKGTV